MIKEKKKKTSENTWDENSFLIVIHDDSNFPNTVQEKKKKTNHNIHHLSVWIDKKKSLHWS